MKAVDFQNIAGANNMYDWKLKGYKKPSAVLVASEDKHLTCIANVSWKALSQAYLSLASSARKTF